MKKFYKRSKKQDIYTPKRGKYCYQLLPFNCYYFCRHDCGSDCQRTPNESILSWPHYRCFGMSRKLSSSIGRLRKRSNSTVGVRQETKSKICGDGMPGTKLSVSINFMNSDVFRLSL